MFFSLLGRHWKPHLAAEIKGASGGVFIVMRGLECERHDKTGKLRFSGDFGAFLVDWLSLRWKEEDRNPTRMRNGSPWKWKVQIHDFPTVELDVIYSQSSSEDLMFDETLEAIINALKGSSGSA